MWPLCIFGCSDDNSDPCFHVLVDIESLYTQPCRVNGINAVTTIAVNTDDYDYLLRQRRCHHDLPPRLGAERPIEARIYTVAGKWRRGSVHWALRL